MKTQREENGIVTLTPRGVDAIQNSPMMNDDLRPTTKEEHNWNGYNFGSLWVGMAICLPTYTLAAGLIAIGMNWWQAIITIVLGNAIVLIPILLNSHAGTKFGIPYPVYARLWFGTKGAHIPSLARAIIAAGWFGINCWFAGMALNILLIALFGWENIPGHTAWAFLLMWGLNVWVAYRGLGAIKRMEAWGAPVLVVMGLALLFWAYSAAGGWGPMLSTPSKFTTTSEFLKVFFPALTGAIAFWSTIALNIPDFCRYSKSQKAQVVGQSVALPLSMGLFSFIGIAVASSTVVIYGEAIWDPAVILAKFSPFVIFLGTIGITLATLTTNVAANVVAPARAFENLFPRKITFGMGAIITGLLALLMQPWYILETFGNYIFGWLGTYGALLGPIDGIAIADYWLVRRQRIALTELYLNGSRYDYRKGYNFNAIYALLIGVGISVLGQIIPGLHFLWDNAWTFGLFASLLSYTYLMKNTGTTVSSKEYSAITEFVNANISKGSAAANRN